MLKTIIHAKILVVGVMLLGVGCAHLLNIPSKEKVELYEEFSSTLGYLTANTKHCLSLIDRGGLKASDPVEVRIWATFVLTRDDVLIKAFTMRGTGKDEKAILDCERGAKEMYLLVLKDAFKKFYAKDEARSATVMTIKLEGTLYPNVYYYYGDEVLHGWSREGEPPRQI